MKCDKCSGEMERQWICETCGEKKVLFCSRQDCEFKELLQEYQREIEMCYEIAHRLDILNPEIPGAFIGSPSTRIERQLRAQQVWSIQREAENI